MSSIEFEALECVARRWDRFRSIEHLKCGQNALRMTSGRRQLEPDDVEGKWVWLNALLDARNPEYRAALPAVLKAVTEFIKRVLAAHPLYTRRR